MKRLKEYYQFCKDYFINNKKQCINLLIFIIVISLIGTLAFPYYSQFVKNPSILKEYLNNFGIYQYIIFILINMAKVFLPMLPGEIVEFAGGFCFGWFLGCLLCIISNGLAAILIYLLIHKVNKNLIYHFVSKQQIEQFDYLNKHSHLTLILLIIYLIPGTPKDILTYILPLTQLKLFPIVIITTIARIPSVVTSTLAGDTFYHGNIYLTIIIYIITAIISILGLVWYKHFSKKNIDG